MQASKHERLRASAPARPFSVILVEPEIPPNTGNIARLCAATGSILYLVGKLGFRIDEHAVRRAGLDYWHLVDVRTEATLEAALARVRQDHQEANFWLFTGRAPKSYLQAPFAPGDALVFGGESRGLAPEILDRYVDRQVGIPLLGAVRSLNLANAAAIGVYEALRQAGALDAAAIEPMGVDTGERLCAGDSTLEPT